LGCAKVCCHNIKMERRQKKRRGLIEPRLPVCLLARAVAVPGHLAAPAGQQLLRCAAREASNRKFGTGSEARSGVESAHRQGTGGRFDTACWLVDAILQCFCDRPRSEFIRYFHHVGVQAIPRHGEHGEHSMAWSTSLTARIRCSLQQFER